MKNISQLMKQAQEMQSRMAEMQEQLAAVDVTGQSGAGMVRVTLNGKGEMRGVKIEPAIVDPADPTMLEDLIVAAFNDARAKVEAAAAEQMQKIAGDLPLPPGFKLPF